MKQDENNLSYPTIINEGLTNGGYDDENDYEVIIKDMGDTVEIKFLKVIGYTYLSKDLYGINLSSPTTIKEDES